MEDNEKKLSYMISILGIKIRSFSTKDMNFALQPLNSLRVLSNALNLKMP